MLPPPSCRAWQRARPSAGCPLQPWQILCNTEDFCHWVVPWGLPGRRTLESGEEHFGERGGAVRGSLANLQLCSFSQHRSLNI